jgi:Zn-finger nucleic acid-binding protein
MMKKIYNCPVCNEKLNEVTACGAESYFCPKCNCMISRSKIVGHPNYMPPEKK